MTVLDTETEVTVSTRRRLPNRREHQLIDFEHGGIRYTAGIGRRNGDGSASEPLSRVLDLLAGGI